MTSISNDRSAPTSVRRAVIRCATVAGLSAGAWLTFPLSSTANAEGLLDATTNAVQGVSSSAEQFIGGTAEPIGQIAAPLVDAVAPASSSVADVAAPVVDDVAEPVVSEVVDAVEPVVVEVVQDAVPIVEAVYSPPLIDEVAEVPLPIVDTVAEVAAPVVAPVVSPVAGPVAGVFSPVNAVLATPLANLLVPIASPLDHVELAATLVASDRSGGGVPATGVLSSAPVAVPGNAWISLSDLTFEGAIDQAKGVRPVLLPAATSSLSPTATTPVGPPVPVPAGAPGCTGGTAITAGCNGSGSAAVLSPASQIAAPALATTALPDPFAGLPNRVYEPGFSPA